MRVKIPATVEAAVTQLNGVEALLTAKEWEKAAIIAAFVKPDKGNGGRAEVAEYRHLESARTFAARKITGLTNHETVLRYVTAWGDRPRPVPGKMVELPTEPFPTVKTKEQDVKTQPGAVAKALGDPAFRAKVLERTPHEAAEELMVDSGKRAEETRPEHKRLKPIPQPTKATLGLGLALQMEMALGELDKLEVAVRDTLNEIPAGRRLHTEDVELVKDGIVAARRHLDNIEAMLTGTIDDADLDKLLGGA